MAINSGSDITIDAADIVLMKDSLYDVVNALRISKSSFRRIKINFVWAFLYNILLIPIAMGILYPVNNFKLDPMLAGLAMALSSISVVISSLMLKIFKPITSLESINGNLRSRVSSGDSDELGSDRSAYGPRKSPISPNSSTTTTHSEHFR